MLRSRWLKLVRHKLAIIDAYLGNEAMSFNLGATFSAFNLTIKYSVYSAQCSITNIPDTQNLQALTYPKEICITYISTYVPTNVPTLDSGWESKLDKLFIIS